MTSYCPCDEAPYVCPFSKDPTERTRADWCSVDADDFYDEEE